MTQRIVATIAFALMGASGCGTGVRTYESWQTTPAQSARPQARNSLAVEATLKPGSSLAVEFGVSGARLDEGGDAAPALLYELPAFDGTHMLTVTSKPRGGERGPGIVYPRVRLLDAQRVPTREFASGRFIYRDGLQATIFLNPVDRRERYVLVTPDAVPEDRLLRFQSASTAPSRVLAPFDRGVLVVDFRPVPVERVPFP